MSFFRTLLGDKPKIEISQFNSLAEPANDHWMKWKTYVIECSFNYPMPSTQAVLAIERGTQRMSDVLLNHIRDLDDRLALKGTLFKAFVDLEEGVHQFKSSPDGPGFQSLGKKVDKALAVLDQVRRKRTIAS